MVLKRADRVNVFGFLPTYADVGMTLNVYAHVLPSAQQDAAATLAAVLHG